MLFGNREFLIPYASEQLSIAGTVVRPTATKLKPTSTPFLGVVEAKAIKISVDTNPIYITTDGTTATTDLGVYLDKNVAPHWVYGDECALLQMIRVGSNTGRVFLTYYY